MLRFLEVLFDPPVTAMVFIVAFATERMEVMSAKPFYSVIYIYSFFIENFSNTHVF